MFLSQTVVVKMFSSLFHNTLYVHIIYKGLGRIFFFSKIFIQSKRLLFLAAPLSMCLNGPLHSDRPPSQPHHHLQSKKIYDRVMTGGCVSPLAGPEQHCRSAKPLPGACSPPAMFVWMQGSCHQTSSLTSFVRCQTQQVCFSFLFICVCFI